MFSFENYVYNLIHNLKFGKLIRYVSGDVEEANRFMSLEFREEAKTVHLKSSMYRRDLKSIGQCGII